MTSEIANEQMPPKELSESQQERAAKNWKKLIAHVLVYLYATSLQAVASGLYAIYRSRREPGVLAPSIRKEVTIAEKRVTRASERLAKAEAKAKAVAEKVNKRQKKAKAKANAKSAPSGSPASSSGASSSSATTMTPSDPATSKSGGTHKSRLVATGYADPGSQGMADPSMANPPMNITLMQQFYMWMAMQQQQQQGEVATTDISDAFLNSAGPSYYDMSEGYFFPECGGALTQSEDTVSRTVCEWNFIREAEEEVENEL